MELELLYFTNSELYGIFSMAYPPNILSFLPKQCLPSCLCAAVAHGSVSPTHCTGVSPFLSSCTTTKRAPCKHLSATSLLFQECSNNNLFWFLAEQVSLRWLASCQPASTVCTVCPAQPASSPDKLLSKLCKARLKQRKMWVQNIQTWQQSKKSIRQ